MSGDVKSRRRPSRHALATLAFVALLVSSGCLGMFQFGSQGDGDPLGDELGWEDGYWYYEDISVTASDGFNEQERDVIVARMMARIEHIRKLEFEREVPVEIISRDQFLQRREQRTATSGDEFNAFNNQVWEALFLVGERRDVAEVFDVVFGSAVTGFYSPQENRIVIISETDAPTLDRKTLAHELVHALQDQHFGLAVRRETQDGQLAADGLIEGGATLVERIYERRCNTEWSCIEPAVHAEADGGGGDGGDSGDGDNGGDSGRDGAGGESGGDAETTPPKFNYGLFLTVYSPYAEGPAFVASIRERGGWEAVNEAYENIPVSMEQVIHPSAYPDEDPVSVEIPDRSSAAWEPFEDPHFDRVGEASIYAMFWANRQVPRGDRTRYDYSYEPSAGWAGDRVVPYRNGAQFGYVWKTVWDTEADAKQFVRTYRDVLQFHNATHYANAWVIPDADPYDDAFRVTRRGNTVVIVNAPTRETLDDVH